MIKSIFHIWNTYRYYFEQKWSNDIEVNAKVQAGNKCYYRLTKSLNLQILSRRIKKTVVTDA